MRFAFPAALTLAAALVLSGCTSPTVQNSPAVTSAASSPVVTPTPSPAASVTTAVPKDTRTGKELNKPFAVQGIFVISKQHRISASYGPANPTGPNHLEPEVAKALAKMTAAAKADGVTIRVKSGYRTYATQNATYVDQLKRHPENINYYAPAGASEHQTGLAVDLWDGKVWYAAMQYTAAGKWLHKHCHEYGFILRFPKNTLKITGVEYEPWHFRYVGVDVASKFDAANTLTLEEYLNLA